MLRVGLTGGLACGKSFVAAELARLGCHVIQADELGHQVLLPSGEAYQPTLNEFGPGILDPDLRIDRRKLAALVFSDPAKLQKLNEIVHPAVQRLQDSIAAGIAASDPRAIMVVEAAILVETGSYRRFDKLIVVACTRDQQMERAMRRNTYSKEEMEARLSRQLPLEEKRRLADYVIDTSGAKEQAIEQTRKVWESLRGIEQ